VQNIVAFRGSQTFAKHFFGRCPFYSLKSATLYHRNLIKRPSMFALVVQLFLGKEYLRKNQLISTLDNVIYFK
jgi:hypothetical protein